MVFRAATLATTAVGILPFVAAHGIVNQIESGGRWIDTWHPFTDPYLSPVPSKPTRKFKDDGPVEDVTSKAITCNTNGDTENVPVKTVAQVGEKLTFYWTKWPEDHRGPVMTYMANCNGDCSKFDGSGDVWFKIDEAGYANGKWATDKLIADNSSWTVTIPSSIASGQYLLRHEILALHSANAPNGAQFYPSCNQISITTSGNVKPKGVALPGAYSAKDPGILVDIWADGFKSYKIPGPPVFSGSSSSGSPSLGSSSSGSLPAGSPPSASSATSASSSYAATATSSASAQPSDNSGDNEGDDGDDGACSAVAKKHKAKSASSKKKGHHHKSHKKGSKKGSKKGAKKHQANSSRLVKTRKHHSHHHGHKGQQHHNHARRDGGLDVTSFLVRSE